LTSRACAAATARRWVARRAQHGKEWRDAQLSAQPFQPLRRQSHQVRQAGLDLHDFDTNTAHLIIQTKGGRRYLFHGHGGIAQSLLRQVKPGVGVIVVQFDPSEPSTILAFWFS
jgi:hypothetical protein